MWSLLIGVVLFVFVCVIVLGCSRVRLLPLSVSGELVFVSLLVLLDSDACHVVCVVLLVAMDAAELAVVVVAVVVRLAALHTAFRARTSVCFVAVLMEVVA